MLRGLKARQLRLQWGSWSTCGRRSLLGSGSKFRFGSWSGVRSWSRSVAVLRLRSWSGSGECHAEKPEKALARLPVLYGSHEWCVVLVLLAGPFCCVLDDKKQTRNVVWACVAVLF